ncbi:DUF1992 domain-containing protein [Paenibacillus sp. 453mf]|uniref:DnaJ family domain-containing protein n=1 Tax=Paenibacillus sp. 453mf TaxID=1761874 RepID=UPI0008EAB5FF|nr:DUF1992 domain-containing protein [Paenibacillus sp. 453mf]SFS93873.1 protein of unknown function [Paenibacillus sp. 453mf]
MDNRDNENNDPKVSPEQEKYSSKPVQYTTNYVNHIDSIYNDFAERGGMDNLKGQGKPLEISDGSVVDSMMKNANYLPKWIELQKEIRAHILATLEIMENNGEKNKVNEEIDTINLKIQKYNLMVPTSILQKGFISPENIKNKYSHWE